MLKLQQGQVRVRRSRHWPKTLTLRMPLQSRMWSSRLRMLSPSLKMGMLSLKQLIPRRAITKPRHSYRIFFLFISSSCIYSLFFSFFFNFFIVLNHCLYCTLFFINEKTLFFISCIFLFFSTFISLLVLLLFCPLKRFRSDKTANNNGLLLITF